MTLLDERAFYRSTYYIENDWSTITTKKYLVAASIHTVFDPLSWTFRFSLTTDWRNKDFGISIGFLPFRLSLMLEFIPKDEK